MSEEPASYGTVPSPTVEVFATFSLKDSRWSMSVWPGDYRPLTGKVFRVVVPVPAELVGASIQAEVTHVV